MIIRNETDQRIEMLKSLANLKGDVYLINGHLLESLESHNATFGSHCATIEDAETERLEFMAEEMRQIALLAELEPEE